MALPSPLAPRRDTSVGSSTPARARALVIAEAWALLGEGVSALSNASGRPLARTVKLVLDPLVIRPVQNPHLGGSALDAEAAAELTTRMRDAADALRATASWFQELKRARRALRITDGNPQDLYFQRCFELARIHGEPGTEAEAVAADVVAEVQRAAGDALLARIRSALGDDAVRARLQSALDQAWARRGASDSPADATADVFAALDACVDDPDATEAPYAALVDSAAGSAAATALDEPGGACALGLTVERVPVAPALGENARKKDLPRPFDRSIFERLFAAFSSSANRELEIDAEDLLDDEAARSARPWQLAHEHSRVIMLLGREASVALDASPMHPAAAHRMLRARWSREAYVRRVLRLPAAASGVPEALREDVRVVRQGYLRRLWVRLHGRELRGHDVSAAELWDTLDGVLRSVVMDQRQRLKTALGRELPGAA
ncbi:hypothetical protein GCM10025768_23550 [Microbacterium pseudoresistens]|uniref:Uncharacterized protein n=1 Tax=Microbacterium pseudoresistens TaxID=640634 RepID=A0A7Y9JLS7_9MICO|nr:hypothetical protein [Microbacterium pseudoresistens]NYD53650.1 hypothetical protein [Microbacterium pseudoresistens]